MCVCCTPLGFTPCSGGGGGAEMRGLWHSTGAPIGPGGQGLSFALQGITTNTDQVFSLLAASPGAITKGNFQVVFTLGAIGDFCTISFQINGVNAGITIVATKILLGAETVTVSSDVLTQTWLRGDLLNWHAIGTSPGGTLRISIVRASAN